MSLELQHLGRHREIASAIVAIQKIHKNGLPRVVGITRTI